MDPVVDLLRELVAIDSVNPSLVEGGAGEAAIAQFIGQWMRRAGFDVRVDEIAPGRVNVVAIAEGAGDGPARMLCGALAGFVPQAQVAASVDRTSAREPGSQSA